MRLAVEELGPPGGPPVVLAHGFTQTGRSWSTVAAALAGDGWRVRCVDLPGHGGSGGVHADLVRGAALLGDAGGEAVYVGYSMGGRHCLQLALDAPALVRALVLLGATAGIDDPDERAARRAADDALAAQVEHGGVPAFLDRWLALPLFARLPDDPAARTERERNTAEGLAASLRLAGTGTQEPAWDRLDRLAMPVLVLAGEHDDKFLALAHRLRAGIPHADLAAVPGAGHAAHLEQPDAFLAIVRPWLAANAR